MAKIKMLSRIAKNALIGGAAGFASARFVSTSNDAPRAGKSGAELGAALGAASGLPIKGTAKLLHRAAVKYGQTAPKIEAGIKHVFRRIRGRIVRIKVKS